jgi:pseudolysin
MHKQVYYLFVTFLGMVWVSAAMAATPIDLRHQPVAVLQTFFSGGMSIKEIKSDFDFNQTNHVRLQQIFSGYPVWGADAVIHIPRGEKMTWQQLFFAKDESIKMNGVLYQNLTADLNNSPAYIFSKAQKEKAIQTIIQLYLKKSGTVNPLTDVDAKLLIYIDSDYLAHWAFHIRFQDKSKTGLPALPNYIIDARTFINYETWDDIQTVSDASGGGFGGNIKMGKFVYDALLNDYPVLPIQRDDNNKICYLQNADVTVKDSRHQLAVIKFNCVEKSKQHNNVYWDADQDAINNAYSPSNDALSIGKIIKDMFQKWYGIPVLTQNGKPMMLNMVVHEKMENAYWDGKQMVFGDGGSEFYPLVSLGVGAHEISHGFTAQHSNLHYSRQSGGLNEAFSDMAASAAEFYFTGKNNWQIGSEVMKAKNVALRYMDEPIKDCVSHDEPGQDCSINNAKDYRDGVDVHFSSGVYNKMFYLLSTAPGWNTKKAFDVMVHANAYYWTSTSNFVAAGCGVQEAAKDFHYDTSVVNKALEGVGIKATYC